MPQFLIPDYILLFIAVLNFILSFFIFLNDPRNKVNQSFALFAFFISFWPVTLFLFRNGSLEYAEFWMNVSYLAAAGIALFLWFFVHYFPVDIPRTISNRLLPLISTLFLIGLFFVPNFLTSGVVQIVDGSRSVISEWLGHSIFSVYFIVFFFGAIILLRRKFCNSTGQIKRQSQIIFYGILISGIFGTVFNLILPSPYFNNFSYIYLGPIFTFLFVLSVSYAIAKHQLMNIKALATEFFVILLFLLSLVQIIFAKDASEVALLVSFSVLILIFGVFLVRSVLGEVRRREEISQLAESLEQANIRLRELDQQKTEFLSIASHQLRTPLSILKGYIELIRDGAYGKPSKKMISTLNDMDESNERLVKLVDEFLNITRMEQGRTKYTFEEKDVNEIAASVVKELHDRAAAANLRLIFSPANGLKKVYLDEEKIRNVIFNYVDNAIKYSEKGTIKIFTSEENQGVSVRVKDSGLGFDRADQASFFQKFYRGVNVRHTNVNGTGLGLYVCRKFVESHGGKVWAKSSGEGKGSEFGLWIPYDGAKGKKAV